MQKEDILYRRNGKLIYIKQPKYDELLFTAKLWSSEETMKDIGGIYNFTENQWNSFYKKMVYPTDGKNFYCLIYTIENKPVGEVSFHGYDPITKIARSNIKIYHEYRNNGYGKEAMKLILEYYFLNFQGKIIMDNIKNHSSKAFATSMGFKVVRKYQDEVTCKLTKEQFLNFRDEKVKNISIIMYDDMDITNYTLICNMFNKANMLANKNIFNVQAISILSKANYSNNLKMEINLSDENLLKPNIIILPDAHNIENLLTNNKIIDYILTYYNDCDYICAIEDAIKFLVTTNSLHGIVVPNIDNISDLIHKNKLCDTKIINKNFVDNGKIMISANLMGIIEMGLTIIFKIGGKELVDKVQESIGFNEYIKA